MFACSVQSAQRIVISGETGCSSQVVIAIVKAVGIGQQIVALYFRFIFLELADFRFAGSQCHDISCSCIVVHFHDRQISTSVVGSIVHREHRFEGEMFQKVHFTIDITRCPVVFGFGRIGFQLDVYHRIVDLCFLKFG